MPEKVAVYLDRWEAQKAAFLVGLPAFEENNPESWSKAISIILKRYSDISDVCMGD